MGQRENLKNFLWKEHCHGQFEFYPYDRLPLSYVLFKDQVFFYKEFAEEGDLWEGTLQSEEGLTQVRDWISDSRVWLLGYGANASPGCLKRKLKACLEEAPLPVLRAHLQNFDGVFVSSMLPTGVIPATLFPSPQTLLECVLLAVNSEQLEVLNQSEFLGKVYELRSLPGSQIKLDSPKKIDSVLTYFHLGGVLSSAQEKFPLAIEGCKAQKRRFPAKPHRTLLETICEALEINYCDFTALVYSKKLFESREYAKIESYLEHFSLKRRKE